MKITNEMIHPQLRRTGRVLRRILPFFTEKTFHFCNRAMVVMRGRHTKKVCCNEIWIPYPDTDSTENKLRLCVYTPKEPRENVPGLLWIHGGGYAIGAPEQDEGFIIDFIAESGCVVVAPDYRLSTEAPYPAALNDCYTALLWLKEHATEYHIREDQLMVGGDSAGGGLTAALCIYARDKKEVAVAYQMPLYPMLDDRMITESSQDNDAPVWNTKSNENGWKLYLGNLYGTNDVPAYAAPARLTDFTGLPPAFTFVGSIEPFRDEAITYMENLKVAGIPAEYQVFDGCFHAFDLMGAHSAPGKESRELLRQNFRYAVEHYFAAQPGR